MSEKLWIWSKTGAAGHGRPKEIAHTCSGVCDVCEHDDATCLGFDSSEGEYGPVWICETCAHTAFTTKALPMKREEP